MHTKPTTLRSIAVGGAATLALAFTLVACGGTLPTSVPSITVPTLPADATEACVDAPTMAVLDQLQATGADLPALLAANKDALLGGLGDLESSDPAVTTWRDALVDALESGDMAAAAAEIAKLADDAVTLPRC